jgi:ABC-type polysaccharide transport system permease subunit
MEVKIKSCPMCLSMLISFKEWNLLTDEEKSEWIELTKTIFKYPKVHQQILNKIVIL